MDCRACKLEIESHHKWVTVLREDDTIDHVHLNCWKYGILAAAAASPQVIGNLTSDFFKFFFGLQEDRIFFEISYLQVVETLHEDG